MVKILFLFLSLPIYAESFRLDDPHYIDLVPATFNDPALCRNITDQSNSIKCQTRVEACDYASEIFTTVAPFKIKKLKDRDHLFAQVEGFEYTERGFGFGETAEFKTISLPNKFKVYSISRGNYLSVWDFGPDSNRNLFLSLQNDFQTLEFDLRELDLEPQTAIYLFGQSVGRVVKDKPLAIPFSTGTYNLVFTFGQSNKKVAKTIVVSKDVNPGVISLRDNRNPKLLEYRPMIGMIDRPIDKSSITRFFEKKQISLVQKGIRTDVSSIFKSSPDSFLRTEKEIFTPKLVHSPARLEIKGTCKVSEFKPQSVTLPVFSDSGKTKKKGDLIASFDDGVSYQYVESGKKSEFIPNISHGYCMNSEAHLGIQRVVAAENSLSNLGKGPWGKDGWIEMAPSRLFNSDFIFFAPGSGAIKIRPTENENVFKFDYFAREGQVEDVREIKRNSLVAPDGSLIVKIDCDSGC